MRLNYTNRYFADVTIGAKLTLDGGEATKTMKQFKQEVKDANTELLNTQARFGATSKEALAAAKRVAELKDNIQDANETVKLFDPGSKFQVIGNAVRGLVGGFTALQGALALAGVEGEEVQKTLLKVQGALALTEGLNVIADVTKDFQRLGSVLVQTLGKSGLIGVAVAGVALLAAAFLGVFDSVSKLTLAQRQLNEVNKEAIKNSVKERSELKLLYDVAKNTTLSVKERLSAVGALQKEFPGYFDNIKTEKNLNNDLTTAYNLAAAGIINKAKATATFNKIVENENKILEEQGKIEDLNVQRTKVGIPALIYSIDQAIKARTKSIQELTEANTALANSVPSTDIVKTFGGGSTKSASTPRAAAAKKESEEIKIIFSEEQDNKLQKQIDFENNSLALRKIFLDAQTTADVAALDQQRENNRINAEGNILIAQQEAQARVEAAQSIGGALSALSQLIGEQTAAGKALAIAQAVINTWLGVTEVLRTKSVLPEPLATISRIANITAVVASGLNAVKNIGKAKVPGASSAGAGGGGLAAASNAPLQPRAPGATNTLLNQDQLNQIGNASVRAFVIEADVSSNQERVRRLNRAARI